MSNPCPPVPEPVAIEGYLHYNAHFRFFEGGNSPELKSNTHGSGVGLVTGVKYQFHELGTVRGTYTYESGRLETERWIRSHLISQTGLGNFFMTTRVRQVCTPEGCQEEIVSIDTDCRG